MVDATQSGAAFYPRDEILSVRLTSAVTTAYNHGMLDQSVELSIVAGSRARPYRIEVLGQGDKVSVFCDCPAGALGRFCKHKAAVISGDQSLLASPDEETEAWKAACQLLADSTLPAKLMELRDAERDPETSKQQIKSLKLRLSRQMQDGA